MYLSCQRKINDNPMMTRSFMEFNDSLEQCSQKNDLQHKFFTTIIHFCFSICNYFLLCTSYIVRCFLDLEFVNYQKEDSCYERTSDLANICE